MSLLPKREKSDIIEESKSKHKFAVRACQQYGWHGLSYFNDKRRGIAL